MIKGSMMDIAVGILENHGSELAFGDLWSRVVQELGLSDAQAANKIAKLYSDITLDKRFISLPDNKWDLRKRRTLNETIIDTSDIILEDDDDIVLYDDVDSDYEDELDDYADGEDFDETENKEEAVTEEVVEEE